MNLSHTSPMIFALLVAAATGSAASALAIEPATESASGPVVDSARLSLKQRAYPWYDQTKDSFRPLRPTRKLDDPESPASLNIPGSSLLAQVVYLLAWSLLAVLLIGLIIALVRSLQIFDFDDDTTPSQQPEVTLETLQALPLPEKTQGIRDFLKEAEKLASQSLYGQAMTFYFSWQLLQLNQQQIIELEKGKTNRQYSKEVQSSMPDLTDLFRQSIRLFEDAFFGNLPVSAYDFQRVWGQRGKFTVTRRRPLP